MPERRADQGGAIWHPSPNCGARRGNVLPDLVVLHYTAMRDAEAALTRLCLAEAEVSAHYLIAEDGRCWQMVAEAERAWHAGAGAWGEVRDVNSRSIGVELANDALSPFSEPQMTALEALLGGILRRWGLPAHRVIGHSDCAPGRKVDPGPRFDWARLARQGLAAQAGRGAPGDLAVDLQRVGYTGSDDAAVRLTALRLRHRPGATGPADDVDRAIAADLAARYPAEGPR